jgi:membrane fusion protein, multidrug efflux system
MHGGKALEVDAYDRTQQKLLAKGKADHYRQPDRHRDGNREAARAIRQLEWPALPNQFVNTRLLVKTLDNQTLVPSSAVQHNGAVDFVYLIQKNKAGKAVMRTVKSGISDQGNTAVTGINPGDVVANSSFQKLVNGLAHLHLQGR